MNKETWEKIKSSAERFLVKIKEDEKIAKSMTEQSEADIIIFKNMLETAERELKKYVGKKQDNEAKRV